MWCMKRVYMMQRCGVTPHVVFDGAKMPLKADTESGRRESRTKNLAKGRAFLASGNTSMANKHFQRAVTVSPSMVCTFMQMLRDEGVKFTVAPYEADAQLAHLARTRQVDAVISEDSDLLVFGCPRVIFKMDDGGTGQMISLDRVIGGCGMLRPFDMVKFQEMCVLAGCDYLPSIPGLALRKARQFLRQARNADQLFKKLRWDIKFKVPKDYPGRFKMALLGFRHQRVFDLKQRTTVHLTPLPQDVVSRYNNDTEFLGPALPDSLARGIADGLVNPRTQEPYPSDVLSCMDPGASMGRAATEEGKVCGPAHPWGPLSHETREKMRMLRAQYSQQLRRSRSAPAAASSGLAAATPASHGKQLRMDQYVARRAEPRRPLKRRQLSAGGSTAARVLKQPRHRSPYVLSVSSGASQPFRRPTQHGGSAPQTTPIRSRFFAPKDGEATSSQEKVQQKPPLASGVEKENALLRLNNLNQFKCANGSRPAEAGDESPAPLFSSPLVTSKARVRTGGPRLTAEECANRFEVFQSTPVQPPVESLERFRNTLHFATAQKRAPPKSLSATRATLPVSALEVVERHSRRHKKQAQFGTAHEKPLSISDLVQFKAPPARGSGPPRS